MDAAGGWSSMSVGMGFEPSTTLYEAVRAATNKDEDNLKRMFFKANDNLTVLSAGADPMLEASIHAQQYEELIDLMMVKYPVVVVDLSGAIPSLKRTVINRAHELVVVTTPTLPALRSARSLMQEVKLLKNGDLSSLDLIVNMEGMIASKEVPKKDITDALDFKPTMTLPFDAKLFVGSENEGKKLIAQKAGADIVNKLLPIARDVIDMKKSKEGDDDKTKTGFLDKIFKKD
jgi:pilus assembly protein CpaE